ncbi:hypothetical protein HZC07_04295 [Candidatus Micrarchaeota archaeon]|nr:hypothetical protein [Candidatus Micrarchaeota archaeon]
MRINLSQSDRSIQGFLSYDALISILPITIMLLFTFQISAFLIKDGKYASDRQVVFDKLVSIADYTVKSGAVVSDASINVRYPNWIDETIIDATSYGERLRTRSNLKELYISTTEPSSTLSKFDFCIYRLVVVGSDRENLQIKKLYVCGE